MTRAKTTIGWAIVARDNIPPEYRHRPGETVYIYPTRHMARRSIIVGVSPREYYAVRKVTITDAEPEPAKLRDHGICRDCEHDHPERTAGPCATCTWMRQGDKDNWEPARRKP